MDTTASSSSWGATLQALLRGAPPSPSMPSSNCDPAAGFVGPPGVEGGAAGAAALPPAPRAPAFSASCPVVLVRRCLGGGVPAWSLLLPAHWAPPFWQRLCFLGARPAGQLEWRWLACHHHMPAFPYDFPFTPAGKLEALPYLYSKAWQHIRLLPISSLAFHSFVRFTPGWHSGDAGVCLWAVHGATELRVFTVVAFCAAWNGSGVL